MKKLRLVFNAQFVGHDEAIVEVKDDITDDEIKALFPIVMWMEYDDNCYWEEVTDSVGLDGFQLRLLTDNGYYCFRSRYNGCPYKQCSLHDYNFYKTIDDPILFLTEKPEYVRTDCRRYLDK